MALQWSTDELFYSDPKFICFRFFYYKFKLDYTTKYKHWHAWFHLTIFFHVKAKFSFLCFILFLLCLLFIYSIYVTNKTKYYTNNYSENYEFLFWIDFDELLMTPPKWVIYDFFTKHVFPLELDFYWQFSAWSWFLFEYHLMILNVF